MGETKSAGAGCLIEFDKLEHGDILFHITKGEVLVVEADSDVTVDGYPYPISIFYLKKENGEKRNYRKDSFPDDYFDTQGRLNRFDKYPTLYSQDPMAFAFLKKKEAEDKLGEIISNQDSYSGVSWDSVKQKPMVPGQMNGGLQPSDYYDQMAKAQKIHEIMEDRLSKSGGIYPYELSEEEKRAAARDILERSEFRQFQASQNDLRSMIEKRDKQSLENGIKDHFNSDLGVNVYRKQKPEDDNDTWLDKLNKGFMDPFGSNY